MERFIRLNLIDASDKTLSAVPLRQDDKVLGEKMKKLNRFAKKYAGKAAKEYGRTSSGIFTK